MDEYEKMLSNSAKYNLHPYNDRINLTNTVGFFNSRQKGNRDISVESRLFNIGQKNTKDQTLKANPFFGELHKSNSTSNNDFEPSITRNQKSCNKTSENSYIPFLFQPNLLDPRETVQYKNYIGKNSRFDSR